MKKLVKELSMGIRLLPSFPLVLVTVGNNIMTAGAFHFYSFTPPSVMVGIAPQRYTYELINQYNEFGINIPKAEQIELVRICGSNSGKRVADKYRVAGVTPLKGTIITSSLIEECPLNIECVVVNKIDYPGTHQWFVGEIKAVHMDEDYKSDQALMFWYKEYRKVGDFLQNAWE
jgi:flavin reductase (DIM6/NTAB) family NADH-FMN oxidoreductase RutF